MSETDSPVYTLVLRPNDQLASELVRFSELLQSWGINNLAPLGSSAQPHITLVQWAEAELSRLQSVTASLIRTHSTSEVVLAGLAAVPGPEGDLWIEIPVLGADWLRSLQNEAVEKSMGIGRVTNGVGDRFRPHVTVGFTFDSSLTLPHLPSSLLRCASSDWVLSFGLSGRHYTYQRDVVMQDM